MVTPLRLLQVQIAVLLCIFSVSLANSQESTQNGDTVQNNASSQPVLAKDTTTKQTKEDKERMCLSWSDIFPKKARSMTDTIVFDKNGKWVAGYPVLIRKGDKIKFEVIGEAEPEELSLISNKIDGLKSSKTDTVNAAQSYKEIEDLGKMLQEQLFNAATTGITQKKWQQIIDIFPERLPGADTDYIPAKNDTVYELLIKRYYNGGQNAVDTLIPLLYEAEKSKEEKGKYTCVFSIDNNPDRIEFKLLKYKPDNETLVNWVQKNKKHYVGFGPLKSKVDNFKSEARDQVRKVDSLIAVYNFNVETKDDLLISPSQDSVSKRISELLKILPKAEKLSKQLMAINREWMIRWLWWTKGVPQLNPLDITEIDSKNDIEALELKLKILSEELVSFNKANRTVSELDLQNAEKAVRKYYTEQNNCQKQLAQVNEHQKQFLTKKEAIQLKSNILYQGELYISDAESLKWMRHHDKQRNLELRNSTALPGKYWVNDQIKILVHNLEPNHDVSMALTSRPYSPQLWSSDLYRAMGIIVALNKKSTEYFNNKIPGSSPMDTSNIQVSFMIIIPEALKDSLERLEDFDETLEKYKKFRVYYDWLDHQSEPFNDLKPVANDTALYRTLKPDYDAENKDSTEVSYNLIAQDSKAATGAKPLKIDGQKYITYKTVKVLPAAGFMFLFNDRSNTTYDAQTRTFAEQDLGRTDFALGVNYYPWGIHIDRNRRDRRKFEGKDKKLLSGGGLLTKRGYATIANSAFIFGGLGVRSNLLRNYFAGAGLTLTPGLDIHAGVNLFFPRKYEIQNNQLAGTNESLRIRPYVSLGLDAQLIIRFINLFSPYSL